MRALTSIVVACLPSVTQGESSSEWGSSASEHILFDVANVIVDYENLDSSKAIPLLLPITMKTA